MHETLTIRRLTPENARELTAFYNGLSAASKRTFRPLGKQTTVDICARIGAENTGDPNMDRNLPVKYDLIAVTEEGIVGWSFLWNLDAADPEEGPVFGLAVADAYHGRGIGTALMRRMIAWADAAGISQVILTVVQDNAVAEHLYEQQGFVRYGEFISEDGLPYYRMRRTNRKS